MTYPPCHHPLFYPSSLEVDSDPSELNSLSQVVRRSVGQSVFLSFCLSVSSSKFILVHWPADTGAESFFELTRVNNSTLEGSPWSRNSWYVIESSKLFCFSSFCLFVFLSDVKLVFLSFRLFVFLILLAEWHMMLASWMGWFNSYFFLALR